MESRADPFTDWGRFTDERWHVLLHGTDFTRPAKLVRKAAQMWASRNGYRCNVSGDDRRVSIYFTPKGDQ